jgi:S1-C subfamily serine protease
MSAHLRTVILLALVAAACSAAPGELEPPAPSDEPAPAPIVDLAELEPAAFAIRVRADLLPSHREGATTGHCSAFAVDARTFLTAAHCVPETGRVALDGTPFAASAVDIRRDIDVAWLVTDDTDQPELARLRAPDFARWLPLRAPRLGEHVRVIRPFNGGSFEGRIFVVQPNGAGADLPVVPGDSGAPVVGDDGSAVGVASLEYDNDNGEPQSAWLAPTL